jgi:hypothetical protein
MSVVVAVGSANTKPADCDDCAVVAVGISANTMARRRGDSIIELVQRPLKEVEKAAGRLLASPAGGWCYQLLPSTPLANNTS